MKKRIIEIGIVLAIASVAVYMAAAQPVLDPIEAKPIPITEAKDWTIKSEGKLVTIAYYQHFTFPGGSRQQLKSKEYLDAKGWEALAKKYWQLTEAAELNQPEICPYCGRPMP